MVRMYGKLHFKILTVGVFVAFLWACSDDAQESEAQSNQGDFDTGAIADVDDGDDSGFGVDDLDTDNQASGGDDAERDASVVEAFDTDPDTDGEQGDTGDGEPVETDAGIDASDAGEPDEDECVVSLPCDRGVDDSVASFQRFAIEPEDDDAERYGCDGTLSNHEFVGTEGHSVEAQTCADEMHRYRIMASSCSEIDFLIHVDLKPKSEICPLKDFTEVMLRINLGSFNNTECEGTSDSECYEVHENPDHGGYAWTVRLFDVFMGDHLFPVDLDIEPETDVSVPYELVVRVEEM